MSVNAVNDDHASDDVDDEGNSGVKDNEYLKTLADIISSYSKAIDAYNRRNASIFLNLFIPLFWEEDFSDFASNKRHILKILNYQITFKMSLLDKFVKDSISVTTLSFLRDSNMVWQLQSRAMKLKSIVNNDINGDTKLRRYMTEKVAVKCVTHNSNVINRFSAMNLLPPNLPFTSIISHPHGYFKHIGFGKMKQEISGFDQTYSEFNLRKYTKYRLSRGANNNALSDLTNIPFHSSGAMKYGEYYLESDLHLVAAVNVFANTLDILSRTNEFVTWLTFPPGTVSFVNGQ